MTIKEAIDSFYAVDGAPVPIKAGELFAADHPMVVRFPSMFREPRTWKNDVEQATANPGEPSLVQRLPLPELADTKAVWVAYAVENGIEVDGLTKAEIIALCTGDDDSGLL